MSPHPTLSHSVSVFCLDEFAFLNVWYQQIHTVDQMTVSTCCCLENRSWQSFQEPSRGGACSLAGLPDGRRPRDPVFWEQGRYTDLHVHGDMVQNSERCNCPRCLSVVAGSLGAAWATCAVEYYAGTKGKEAWMALLPLLTLAASSDMLGSCDVLGDRGPCFCVGRSAQPLSSTLPSRTGAQEQRLRPMTYPLCGHCS